MFTEDQARELVGKQIRTGVDPAPACGVRRVVGAEDAGDGWVILVQGLVKGVQVVARCGRADWDLYRGRC